MKEKRVVVTGLGMVAPNGIGKEKFWEAIKSGKSGIKKISKDYEEETLCRSAGVIDGWDPLKFFTEEEAYALVRFSQFGVAGCKLALSDARLSIEELKKENSYNRGVALGTTTSGLEFMLEQYMLFKKNKQAIHPYTFSASVPNACASIIAILTDSRGPCKVFGSACAAANDAIGYGFNLIRNNKIDMMFVGGSETPLHPLVINACCIGGIVSKRGIIAPFDKDRDGTLLGEGAGILVLEESSHALNRGAHIYAEVVGYATTCDAHHLVRLLDSGEGIEKAMEFALKDAHISPEEIDYINAHGTGTIPNDKLETKVIKKVFKKHAYKLAVSSTKSMIGHLQGATGALESIATVLAIDQDLLIPTINYQTPDPECDLDYVPNKARDKEINFALKTNSGFGGINSVLIFKKFRK